MYGGWGWKPYVSVKERRRQALSKMEKLKKKGQPISPVTIVGRTIAATFWGKAWCDNLERYSDYQNRLPRGRTYVRNGSVIDLQIAPGQVKAMVSGSSIYNNTIKVAPVGEARWKSICEDCAGAIDSLVELLQGRLSKGVMERICRQGAGLFPSPKEIRLSCDCPDGARMCKHVAAVMYGIGARFDRQPELLFRLRAVDEMELIANAGTAAPLSKQSPAAGKVLGGEDLSAMFGLDMAQAEAPAKVTPKTKAAPKAKMAPKAMAEPSKKVAAKRKAPPAKKSRRPAKG